MISVFRYFKLITLFSALAFTFTVNAQEAIFEIETDETLPIAPMRYDDAVELPKDNFSSTDGKDKWEQYENGELDAKAYVQLQDEYNSLVETKPNIKRKIASQKKRMLSKETEIVRGNLLPKKKRTLNPVQKKPVKKAVTAKSKKPVKKENSRSTASTQKKVTKPKQTFKEADETFKEVVPSPDASTRSNKQKKK